ncbi:MAG: PQQ-binding-like beta-propeller repeat protein [Dehalococcoidales bacterium]|nr:PQQ-binding-like beta-propeller repeat protein [Dehalococcoidales bacterium]
MGSNPETKFWVICPICQRASPAGTTYCKHCWGASLSSGTLVPDEELDAVLKDRASRLKRRKLIRTVIVSLISAALLFSAIYYGLYNFTDIVARPHEDITSDSLIGEWSMFRHDLARSGTVNLENSLPQGVIKWTFSVDIPIKSSPVIVDDIVYFGAQDSKFYALNAVTGDKLWEYNTGGWIESSAAVVNGVVYFGSNDGKLYALDAYSGEKFWDFETPYPIMSSPAVADGVIYFGAGDFYVYAVDIEKGEKLWRFLAGGLINSSPVVANGILYIGSGSEYCYALDAKSGRLRLKFKTYHSVISSPAVNGGIVYFNTSKGFLYAVDGNARTWPYEHQLKPFWIQLWGMGLPLPEPPMQSGFLWVLNIGRTSFSTPIIANDITYVGSDNKLVAVDVQQRKKIWEFEAEDVVRSSPALVDNVIYVGSEDGKLYAVDAVLGEKLWDITTEGKITASPAVVNGVVYISSHDGKLYAIE